MVNGTLGVLTCLKLSLGVTIAIWRLLLSLNVFCTVAQHLASSGEVWVAAMLHAVSLSRDQLGLSQLEFSLRAKQLPTGPLLLLYAAVLQYYYQQQQCRTQTTVWWRRQRVEAIGHHINLYSFCTILPLLHFQIGLCKLHQLLSDYSNWRDKCTWWWLSTSIVLVLL